MKKRKKYLREDFEREKNVAGNAAKLFREVWENLETPWQSVRGLPASWKHRGNPTEAFREVRNIVAVRQKVSWKLETLWLSDREFPWNWKRRGSSTERFRKAGKAVAIRQRVSECQDVAWQSHSQLSTGKIARGES